MTGTTPRRRPSKAVYRRRRLVLIVGLLVIAGIVWLLIAQPWAGAATTSSDEKPETKNTAESLPVPSSQASTGGPDTGAVEGAVVEGQTPTPGATPSAQPCVASEITVEPVTSADTYAGDQQPQFTIKLTNNGPDCTMNVGTSAQRSTDCQSEPSDMIVLIAAGQTVSSATALSWDRTRSAVGTCADGNRPMAPGGGASYHLSVEIGGIPSTEPKQFLLY